MIRFILLDIEGTTTDIHFVHQVLFPYSAERLPAFVQSHLQTPTVREALDHVKKTVAEEQNQSIDDVGAIETLLRWIEEDRKHTALKQLQGMIWKEGFERMDYQAHLYEDVLRALKTWKRDQIQMGIFSSGSVQAQKLLFSHSINGDITHFFSHYFDTQIGSKKDVAAYQAIAETVGFKPLEILFLSDVEAELDAAHLAGFQTAQVVREGTTPSEKHKTVSDLMAVQVPSPLQQN